MDLPPRLFRIKVKQSSLYAYKRISRNAAVPVISSLMRNRGAFRAGSARDLVGRRVSGGWIQYAEHDLRLFPRSR